MDKSPAGSDPAPGFFFFAGDLICTAIMAGWDELTESERAEVIRLLRQTIAADRYPLSPRIRCLKSAADKLDPPPTAPVPYPPLKPPGEPSRALRKKRRR